MLIIFSIIICVIMQFFSEQNLHIWYFYIDISF